VKEFNSKSIQVVSVDAPYSKQFLAAFADFNRSWKERNSWMLAAVRVLGNRYKRTYLGPWWITFSSLLFILGLSQLRIGLRGGDLKESLSYVGLGFIIFGLIIGGIQSGASVFAGGGDAMLTSRLPISSLILRNNFEQVLDFLHDAVAILVIIIVFDIAFSWRWIESLIAVALIVLSGIGVGMWLGPLANRFRDVGPLISAFTRILFFLTPIFWSIDMVSENGREYLAWYNPITYQLLAFRDPILGSIHNPPIGISPLGITAILALVNLVLGFIVFSKYRTRQVYWATTS
jgi:ABC-type polysaccharide/polyol phosphate export permease